MTFLIREIVVIICGGLVVLSIGACASSHGDAPLSNAVAAPAVSNTHWVGRTINFAIVGQNPENDIGKAAVPFEVHFRPDGTLAYHDTIERDVLLGRWKQRNSEIKFWVGNVRASGILCDNYIVGTAVGTSLEGYTWWLKRSPRGSSIPH